MQPTTNVDALKGWPVYSVLNQLVQFKADLATVFNSFDVLIDVRSVII